MRTIRANTADEAWIEAAKALIDVDQANIQPSRAGITRELEQVAISIADPRQRWCITRSPGINPAFAVAEVVWIVQGREDAGFLNFWNSQLPNFAGNGVTYHGAYGKRIRSSFGLDQLDRAFKVLASNPESRQVVLQIWSPERDMPHEDGAPRSLDIPCNLLSMVKIRDGRLSWTQIMRSNDIYRGLPYNLVQFTTLQEVLAGWLGIEVGTFTHFADSLHYYVPDLDAIADSVEKKDEKQSMLCNRDRLDLSKKLSSNAWGEMESLLNAFAHPELTPEGLLSLINTTTLPVAYKNLVCLPAAETARRRGWQAETQALMGKCENPVLAIAWRNWVTSRQDRKVA